jgi:hypothetical protein
MTAHKMKQKLEPHRAAAASRTVLLLEGNLPLAAAQPPVIFVPMDKALIKHRTVAAPGTGQAQDRHRTGIGKALAQAQHKHSTAQARSLSIPLD